VLPSNGGLEQGQSDSGSRLADDLLAGLASSEPRTGADVQREGRREPARERERKGGGRREGASTRLLYGDGRADCVNSTVGEHN